MLTDSEILRRQQRGPGFRFVPTIDWRATLRLRTNVLVTGPNDALTAFLEMARSEMRDPIRSASRSLPRFLDGFRTLVLTEIDGLDASDQQRLRHWFDERSNPDVQVISATSAPLFELVKESAFDADLYYRLNTIYLEVQRA
jgi:hypothetical protein